MCSEHLTKWPKKSPLRRPIGNGEDDVGERAAKVVLQHLPEIPHRAARIIRKRTTSPGTQHEHGMAV